MATFDPIQRTAEALVAVSNASLLVRAVTGRTAGNMRPWDDPFEEGPFPVLAYAAPTASPPFPTDAMGSERVDVTVDAFSAASAAEANALAAAFLAAATTVAFRALSAPLTATVESRLRSGAAREGDSTWRAAVTLTLAVSP